MTHPHKARLLKLAIIWILGIFLSGCMMRFGERNLQNDAVGGTIKCFPCIEFKRSAGFGFIWYEAEP